jgi:hypothetical protein
MIAPDYPMASVVPQAADGGLGRRNLIVPTGCAMHPLTPQEKALEFMLFDLSSCLVPPGQAPRPPNSVGAP